MPLSIGEKLGPYEITAPIGKGGMGEVYRARDTRLNREVAIKISAERFTERFENEARAIAALNHSNICHLYDVGPNYLVMELVEGPTLADRIKEGAIPLDEALAIARQVADGVEAAHEKGVVHRDLKPGNIKIKPDGTVKVLDFGLAKLGGTPTAQGDFSPTLTIGQTEAGVILGTASYMSPEQAKGKVVDQRADIYAFGAVLYEMLTGERLHRGETTTEVLASVIKEEPQWDKVPRQVEKLLKRCLEKDPQKRLRHIGDVMSLVEDAPAPAAPVAAPQITPPARPKWPWVAAGLTVLVVAAGAAWVLKPKPEQPLFQMEISPPEGVKFVSPLTPFALSPDGHKLVFVAAGKDGKRMLWLRSIDSETAAALSGTEGAEVPFWSPDSRWVGFSANGKLQKIDVTGGSQPQVICDIEGRAGGTWNQDGVILFDQGTKPIQHVSAAGGTPTSVFPLDASRGEATHLAPYFLPDGQHFLYYSSGKTVDSKFGSLDGKVNRVILERQSVPTYAPNPRGGGWLVYNARGQLTARPFDPVKGEFTGPSAVIASGVGQGRWWYASTNGIMAFRHSYGSQYQLAWFGRDGHPQGMVGDPGTLNTPRISPDQKTIVFARLSEQNIDVWTFDLTRNTSARFTFEPGLDVSPIWSPDSKNIVYASQRNGASFVVERPANGVGSEVILANKVGDPWYPSGESRDGHWLVFSERSPVHSVIVLRSRDDPNKIVRIQGRENELDASISPDGRWLLYSSAPASRREIIVQSMPQEAGGAASGAGKWQISTEGGSEPMWRADGKEIFYVALDGTMMAVPIESGEGLFRPGAPKPLFQTRLHLLDQGQTTDFLTRQYDVTSDGQRYLLNQHVTDATDAPITVVVNWPKLLEKH
jgi:Tol biopolymer transport system component/predicted Ser/Thr protein kinase